MDQLNYSDLLLSRISELEATYPSEVADKRLVTELANLESVLDESTLCQDFDNEVDILFTSVHMCTAYLSSLLNLALS